MDEQEQVIELSQLFSIFRRHILAISFLTILCGIVAFSSSEFFIKKLYTSEALLYVENSTQKSSNASINVNDISAAQKIVDTCKILFTSDSMLNQISDELSQFEYTPGTLKKIITIDSVNSTEMLKISVKTDEPEKSITIANKVVEVAQQEFKRVIKNASIEVVSDATHPTSHVFPNTNKFTAIGLIIGLVGSYAIFLVIALIDKRVKVTDDLSKIYNFPVFAEIVDFSLIDKVKLLYGSYGKKNNS